MYKYDLLVKPKGHDKYVTFNDRPLAWRELLFIIRTYRRDFPVMRVELSAAQYSYDEMSALMRTNRNMRWFVQGERR